MSPSQKPPYQCPSLILRNLPSQIQRVKGLQTTEISKSHSTDRVMELSERFGKIVKQKRRNSFEKENKRNDSGIILRQTPRCMQKWEFKKPPIERKVEDANRLLRKIGKYKIQDPYEDAVHKILRKGRREFDMVEDKTQGTSAYATTMKELNGTLIKQRQSAKVFANDTLFTPILLQSLCQKFEACKSS